ncbi:MAG: class I SAM-dependent methyltransferase [Bradymonadales bacterium]|nr:class I SAM-dependent methyltransferase [Bradymonadales bacterium]
MDDPLLVPFSSPQRHLASAEIIRAHSTNPADIRSVALQGLDLSTTRSVLDLGCGFGFMAEAIAGRVHADAVITGVDACDENGPAFLEAVKAGGRRGEFHRLRVRNQLPWPDGTFELVIASYSLYYFTEVLPDVARVLRPDGLLVAITHSRTSFRSLVTAAGLQPERNPITDLIGRFCSENAEERLGRYFERIQRVDYPNRLVFTPLTLSDLLSYVQFKLPLLIPPRRPEETAGCSAFSIPEWIRTNLALNLEKTGELTIEKDDTAFHCWRPICR